MTAAKFKPLIFCLDSYLSPLHFTDDSLIKIAWSFETNSVIEFRIPALNGGNLAIVSAA
jgi:hypothetical protein